MHRNRKNRKWVVLAASCAAPTFVHAQNFTWLSGFNGSFSNSAWSPSTPSFGGSSTVKLFFNSTSTSFVASNDLGAPFLVNGFQFSVTGTGTAAIDSSSGNLLRMVDGAAIQPTISNLRANNVGFNDRLDLGPTMFSISSLAGGTIFFNAPITGSGSLSITGNVRFATPSIYTGGTQISGPATITVATDDAFGNGTISFNGGTLRNPTGGSTLPNIVNLANPIVLGGSVSYSGGSLADLSLNGNISGSGTINLTGSGSLRLTGSNSFSGAINFPGGLSGPLHSRLYVNPNSLGSAALVFNGLGTDDLLMNGSGSINAALSISNPASVFIGAANDVSTVTVNNLNNPGSGTLAFGVLPNTGTVVLANASNNNSGTMVFAGGVTKIDNIARIGNTGTILLDGGTVYITNAMDISKPIVLGDYSAINVATLTTATFSGSIAPQTGFIQDAVLKNGNGTLALTATTPGTARWIVNAGTLLLGGTTGSINYSATGSPALTINPGGVVVRNSVNALSDTGSILLAGGSLMLNGDEAAGTLALAANTLSTLALTNSATFTALSHPAGAFINFNANSLSASGRIVFTNAPSGSLLVGGGGAVNTAAVNILAGAYHSNSALGTSSFTTYDVGGVRDLTNLEYTNTITDGASTLNNVNFGSSITLNATTTINSLTTSTAFIGGAGTLNINSGMLIAGNSTTFISIANLGLGNNGLIVGSSGLSITSAINGGNLTIFNSVSMGGSNTYTGSTFINSGGTLSTSISERIPNTSTVYVNSGGVLSLDGITETIAGLSQQDSAHSGGGNYGKVFDGGTLIIGSGNVSSSFAGSIQDSLSVGRTGSVRKIGTGSLNLSGSSSFRGGLFIDQGMVRAEALALANSPDGIAANFAGATLAAGVGDNILGNGTLTLDPTTGNTSELRLGRNVTALSRSITLSQQLSGGFGTAIISTDADPQRGTVNQSGPTITGVVNLGTNPLQLSLSSGTMNGAIFGSGSITISNLTSGSAIPMVTMKSTTTYTGGTVVRNGSLYLLSDVAAIGNSPVGTGAITLGAAGNDSYAEIAGLSGLTVSRAITTIAGTTGFTLALAGRAPSSGSGVNYSGNLSLAAAPVRVFSAANAISGDVGTVALNGQIFGSGSLVIGNGISRSEVWLTNSSNTFTGGTTLTDGRLALTSNGVGTTGPLGTGSLQIAGTTLAPTLVNYGNAISLNNSIALSSDLNVSAANPISLNGSVTLGTGERTIRVANGSLILNGNISGFANLNKDGPGTLLLGTSSTFSLPTAVFDGQLLLGASQTFNALNIGTTARATVTAGRVKVIKTTGLQIASGGALDLNDNDAIIDYSGTSPLSRIGQYLIAGSNSGSWSGAGITSSTAQVIAANPANVNKTAIGFAEASALGISTFDGRAVDATTVLLRYTYGGDTNLDGKVNLLDFNSLATNFGALNKSWIGGDFDYNGVVNTADFTLLANNFNFSLLPSDLPSELPLSATVPEPAALFSAVAAGFVLSRRRKGR